MIQKLPEPPIFIQGNDISSIFLHHIFKIVVVIFHGKFHPFNSFLRYCFEVNNRYKIDPLGYCWNFTSFLILKNLKKFRSGEQILCDTISGYQTYVCHRNNGSKSSSKLRSTIETSPSSGIYC